MPILNEEQIRKLHIEVQKRWQELVYSLEPKEPLSIAYWNGRRIALGEVLKGSNT